MQQHSCLERVRQILTRYPVRRTKFYEDLKAGLFTPGVPLGMRSIAWPSHEIDAVISARVSGKTDDEIRELVKKLTAARKEG